MKNPIDELIEDLKKFAQERSTTGGNMMLERWKRLDFETFIVECARYGRDAFTCAAELFDSWHEKAEGTRKTSF